MKNKLINLMFSLLSVYIIGQSLKFGRVVEGLSFHLDNTRLEITEQDTLENRLMNFHYIKPDYQDKLLKVNGNLNKKTVFIVGNKFGGTQSLNFGRAGNSTFNSLGVFDRQDTLLINSVNVSPKIVTYTASHTQNRPTNRIIINKTSDNRILIPEILVYDKVLSAIEQQKVETFLSVKYGVTINNISEKKYLSSKNEVIWDTKKNKNFNSRITAIGRDDLYGFYQKQSKNISEPRLTMSLDSLQTLNSQNIGFLTDNYYVVLGDNNQPMQFKEKDLLSFHNDAALKRLWKVQVSGLSEQKQTRLYLKINFNSEKNKILIKKYKTISNYQEGNSDDIYGKKINDSTYVFKDIVWDTDGDGYDFFTFALKDKSTDSNINLISTCSDLENSILKIQVSNNLLPVNYTVINRLTNEVILTKENQSQNPIIINNLEPSDYKIEFNIIGNSPIIRTIDLRGSANQNLESNYLWEGIPIELDLNYDTFHYELKDPNGVVSTTPPLLLGQLGTYNLKIINSKACEVVQNILVLSQADYNALNEASTFKMLKMFPNPSRDGNVHLSVELKTPSSIMVQVFNSLGTLILQKNYNSGKSFNISLSIPPLLGFYNVKVITQQEAKTLNLLIN